MNFHISTRKSLITDFSNLGLALGDTVIVHTSFSKIGMVAGESESFIAALLDSVGESGNVVMPTQSWQLCDPDFLADARLESHARKQVRDALPIYDALKTPSRTMGVVAEHFRTWPGTKRSLHPHRSFAAYGPDAGLITSRHEYSCPLGPDSPLQALYDLGAKILLVGVGHDKNTSLHLAEYRANLAPKTYVQNGCPELDSAGNRSWLSWSELVVDDADFPAVGRAFENDPLSTNSHLVKTGSVGLAPSTLLPMPELVDFATNWFNTNRATSPKSR